MTRKMLALASVLTLAGCGSHGLEVSGHVNVATTSAATGFNFPQPVRLDGGAGLITGSCVMTHNAAGSYGIVVDLFTSDNSSDGRAIRSMTIMTRSDASTGSIDAQLGTAEFASSTCQIHVVGLDGGSGQVAFTTTAPCTITGPGGETATVDLELGLTRCGVQ